MTERLVLQYFGVVLNGRLRRYRNEQNEKGVLMIQGQLDNVWRNIEADPNRYKLMQRYSTLLNSEQDIINVEDVATSEDMLWIPMSKVVK